MRASSDFGAENRDIKRSSFELLHRLQTTAVWLIWDKMM
jgi:hypothetical protein